jgi:hypothetical protein
MLRATLFAVFCLGLAGCTSDAYQRVEGPTSGAGDAIAGNTVMQMVDPWQYGVQDTNLRVPADRGDPPAGAASDPAAGGTSVASAGPTS